MALRSRPNPLAWAAIAIGPAFLIGTVFFGSIISSHQTRERLARMSPAERERVLLPYGGESPDPTLPMAVAVILAVVFGGIMLAHIRNTTSERCLFFAECLMTNTRGMGATHQSRIDYRDLVLLFLAETPCDRLLGWGQLYLLARGPNAGGACIRLQGLARPRETQDELWALLER